jgi:hypothetical protein
MPADPSVQRKIDSLSTEAEKLRAQHQATQSAQSDKLKNDLEMLKNKKEQMLDADKKRRENHAAQSEEVEVYDATALVEAMLLGEKAATGGFDYEKQINDRLKKMGKADPDSGTAGSSADAPDAKFTHNGKEHNLEIKQNSKAMYGQIELKHDGKGWDISERSKKKYPETHKAIAASGFLKKINKQWAEPTGDYDEDLKMGNVYHDHPDAEPIKAHYGKDRKTDYIQIGGGHGFYHTGNDAAKLGSPELEGKTQFRARMKYRGTDKKTGKKKYGALIVMGLKDAEKSHHNLDEPTQKEWIEDIMYGHQLAESSECMKHGFEAGETGAPLNNPYEKDSKEYTEYQDGYYRGDAARRNRSALSEQAPIAPAPGVHRIAVTVSDPDHPMVSQRDTKLQKFVRVVHHDATAAVERGKKHFAKKGWKVHDAYHAGNVHESLEEAHKIGDKVEIIGGSAKGTQGHIGEIRHGLYKGAPKTITVYHGEKGATQVKQHLVKRINESHVEFRIDHRDKLTGDHATTFKAHDAKVSDTTDKATYVKVPSHKANSFKSAMKGHGAKVELAEDAKLEEARSVADRLAAAKEMYDSAMRNARTPAERAEAKETYDNVVKRLKEEVILEGAFEDAEENKRSADAAKKQGDMFAHHLHMADHHDNMAQWHASKGRHGEADRHAEKSEKHHEQAMSVKEEVAANNVGGGAIAGTQGDAGKKVVMTKEPLKRKPLAKFKTFVSQEHEDV